MRATRADGRSVAIEHTLIESFIGEREDFERFRRFLPIQSDPSLVLQGKLIDVNLPRGVLAKGLDWETVVEAFHSWLCVNIHSFPEGHSTQLCRITSRAPIDVAVEVFVWSPALGEVQASVGGAHSLRQVASRSTQQANGPAERAVAQRDRGRRAGAQVDRADRRRQVSVSALCAARCADRCNVSGHAADAS